MNLLSYITLAKEKDWDPACCISFSEEKVYSSPKYQSYSQLQSYMKLYVALCNNKAKKVLIQHV